MHGKKISNSLTSLEISAIRNAMLKHRTVKDHCTETSLFRKDKKNGLTETASATNVYLSPHLVVPKNHSMDVPIKPLNTKDNI